jgi:hypothetical protein
VELRHSRESTFKEGSVIGGILHCEGLGVRSRVLLLSGGSRRWAIRIQMTLPDRGGRLFGCNIMAVIDGRSIDNFKK